MDLDMEYSMDDSTQLLEAASEFAMYPGVQTDALAKQFLDRFPLSVVISALQSKTDVQGLEPVLVACLERLFRTKYGASLIPHYMPFLEVGLKADSQLVRRLSCKTVTCLLQYLDQNTTSAVRLVTENGLYPPLLGCLIDGDEEVATASMDAIKQLASSPQGMAIVFPENSNEATHLGKLASERSSLGRVRVFALIVKLFSISSSVASVIYNSNLLNLMVEEVENSSDTLVTLSVLELLYELAEIDHGTEFVSRTNLLQLLSSMISNTSEDPILRSRAMMISGRLLSKENIYSFIDESGIKGIISAIDGGLGHENENVDECEAALEALGQIGLTTQGAILTLTSTPPAARHVIDAAFNRQGHGKQIMAIQAALHALGNISGETRPGNSKMLNSKAEESLRRLVYETASKSSKLTPSGLVLSVLQQTAEVRLACYRVISGMVVRPWFLMEICSKPDIIDILTDGTKESTKIAMEVRHNCCSATYNAFMSSTKLVSDPSFAATSSKLQDAIRRGPYLAALRNQNAQPVVKTAERF